MICGTCIVPLGVIVNTGSVPGQVPSQNDVSETPAKTKRLIVLNKIAQQVQSQQENGGEQVEPCCGP